MSELTPETLRVGVPFPVGEQPDEQAWYDAHATAWEADMAQKEALDSYAQHLPKCWKNISLQELGIGGKLASCTCGLAVLRGEEET